MVASPKLDGYYVSDEDADDAATSGEVRTLRLAPSVRCRLKCKYCCNESGERGPSDTSEQIRSRVARVLPFGIATRLIGEAKGLGARAVVLSGEGETTLGRDFGRLITHIAEQNLKPVIITNLQTMSSKLAAFLRANGVTVIGKLDSMYAGRQDRMTGRTGSHGKIMAGVGHLFKAGYGQRKDNPDEHDFGLSCVVTDENMDGVPDVWEFCRNPEHVLGDSARGRWMVPNLEQLIENGAAATQTPPSPEKWLKLRQKLYGSDQMRGLEWPSFYGAFPGMGCRQPRYNVSIVGWNGHWIAQPCASTRAQILCADGNIPLPDIEEYSLQRLITEHPIFVEARSIRSHADLTGRCGSCAESKCLGCRGAAFTHAVKGGERNLSTALQSEDPNCPRYLVC